MKGYQDIAKKLKAIKKMGYVRTHRAGNTGIGKTLEDLLGIKENNIPGPNATAIELKSARRNVSSMLTLFTKSPLPKKANSVLLQKYGYPSVKNKRKELHTTVNAKDFNRLQGKPAFKIAIKNKRVNLITSKNEILGYWDKETLKKSFERKLPKLLYVKAEAKGKGTNEEFLFNEAWLLSGFSFDNFLKLLKQGVIFVDIRIGQYLNGRVHDHGTAFRVPPDKLDLCFVHRKRIT
ncbi:MAG: glycosyl hydrolase [Parcubacteria group bacterium CG08_land_8_20_14_0_20_38_56]|nr:MAG: glycosyl hydrolase [Parcubacteria group bacterium CG08_land_8_20_14_0_20_38_56]